MEPIPHPPNPPIPVQDERIWIDGCFDFAHHGTYSYSLQLSVSLSGIGKKFKNKNSNFPLPGHAGAILQAKQLGKYLVVGVHSDDEIFENKGFPLSQNPLPF